MLLTLQVSLLKSSRHFAFDFHGARISYLFPLSISKHEENFLLKNPEKKCETEGLGRRISPLVEKQHLPVPSQLTAIYAVSETALQGLADVSKILMEINSNGFSGVKEKVTGR